MTYLMVFVNQNAEYTWKHMVTIIWIHHPEGSDRVADVFAYISWRGDLDFAVVAPNEGDRLILSMLSFMDFEGIVSENAGDDELTLRDAVKAYFKKYPDGNFVPARMIPQNMRRFAAALANCKRFGGILLSGYQTKVIKGTRPDEQIQFAALSARFLDHISVIYRGTDDTLIGWKENFNSALISPIPAQSLAAAYLEGAYRLGYPLALQGHSKGGNLAVYAATSSAVPTKDILSVHDFDGPGFDASFFRSERYLQLKSKIYKFLPEYSIIGLIRESDCKKTVVKCTGRGLAQHNGFHWQYTADGLERAKRLDVQAVLLNSRLKRLYSSLSAREREGFIEGFYRLACTEGRETVTDLTSNRKKLLRNYKALNQEEKESLKLVLAELFRQILN